VQGIWGGYSETCTQGGTHDYSMIAPPSTAGVDARVARSLVWNDGSKTSPRKCMYYYSHDGLGSVRTLTDSAGAVENRYDYLPFGRPYGQGTSIEVSQRYTYTGREESPAGPLMYYRYRHYSPGVGRFMGRDLKDLDERGYVYVLSRATRAVDPFGLELHDLGTKRVVFLDRRSIGAEIAHLDIKVKCQTTGGSFFGCTPPSWECCDTSFDLYYGIVVPTHSFDAVEGRYYRISEA
jgi:RHS repeat-associated protein